VREAGFRGTKINMVVFKNTPGKEIEEMKKFCAERDLELQTIRHFSLPGGFDATGISHPFERPLPCSRCNRIRLTADGFLKPCLFSDSEIEVDFEDIEGSLKRAVDAKPASGSSCRQRAMVQIGG
jgi:cyclic pyranopterin phosphate synthase